MNNYSKEFLEKTIKVWQPYSNFTLTLEDAREIADNMLSLFSFVFKLEKKSGKLNLKEIAENN
jgi:flagellin-specific chaperone FliS